MYTVVEAILRLTVLLGLATLSGVAAPVGPTPAPRAAPLLLQITKNTTRHFAQGGTFLSFDPHRQTSTSVSSLEITANATKTSGSGGNGLIAAEVTEVVKDPKGNSVLVAYYQEANAKAAYTRYLSPPAALPRPTAQPQREMDETAQKWVDLHNRAREPFGAGKLIWREDLVQKAKANAELCTGDHSSVPASIRCWAYQS